MARLHLRRTIMAQAAIAITQSRNQNLLQAALGLVAEHTGVQPQLRSSHQAGLGRERHTTMSSHAGLVFVGGDVYRLPTRRQSNDI